MTAPPPPEPPLWVGVSQRASRLRAAATAAEAARPSVRGPVRWFVRLVADVVRKSDRDRLLALSAETAFFAVLTLFPALLAATAVLGSLASFLGQDAATKVEGAVLDFLDRLLTASADGVIETVRSLFESSGNALTVGALLALVSVSTAFSTMVNTVTIVYDVPETRGWWRRRWLGLLLGTGTVITGALVVTLIVVGPLFGAGLDVVTRLGFNQEYAAVWDYARYPVALLALLLWTATVYHLAPPERGRWSHQLPGALLAAVLWLGASVGLNIYLKVVVVRSPILGSLGGAFILMTWFYLLAAALLIGGELNAILRARARHRSEHTGDEADVDRLPGSDLVHRGHHPPAHTESGEPVAGGAAARAAT